MAAVSERGEDRQDAHATFTRLGRNVSHTGSLNVGANAKEPWRRDSGNNTRRGADNVLDEALATLATVLTARVPITPALKGSRRLDTKGVGAGG